MTRTSSDKEIIRKYRSDNRKSPDLFEDFFYDIIEDDEGNQFGCLITYTYEDAEGFYEGFHKKVIEYRFITTPLHIRMTEDSLNESVRESIRLHAKGTVKFESNKS